MGGLKIVGIGASAGGLKALEAFFSHVPSDLGLVYVVIQHLSPDHPSTLHEILARCTDMPVAALSSGLVPEPNHVFIKPPDQDMEVINGALHLSARNIGPNGLYLPIDSFFSSLAADQGEAAIGIILSGSGSDGSRGLRDIKEQGGVVMVQSSESAAFDGMPNAVIRQNICDVILPPGELATRLAYIARHDGRLREADPELQELSNNELLRQLLRRIEANSRLDFTKYRESTIRRRLEKRMLIRQKQSLKEYTQLALAEPEELSRLRQSFLIGVTRFFRDEQVFELLRTEILPKVLDQVPPGEPIRIWVPACSTGEEAYSIGIILQELLDERQEKREFKIFASDVDKQAIQIAIRGQYDRAISADVPKSLLPAYFKSEKNYFRVVPSLREKFLFAVQNLLVDPPFINMDLVSCRNFLIYVKNKAQARVLNNFHFALKPQAFLLLGPSENIGSLGRAFHTVNRRWNFFQKKEQVDRMIERPVRTRLSSFSLPESLPVQQPARQTIAANTVGDQAPLPSEPGMMDAFSQLLSERYAPPSIFVTRNYDIVYLNGEFEGLLHLPKFHARMHLDHVLDPEPRTLFRAGVDAILRSGKSGIIKKLNVSKDPDQPRWAQIHFQSVDLEVYDAPLALIEIHFSDRLIEGQEAGKVSEAYPPDEMLRQQVHTLERELKTARSKAQKLLNELEATNEELQTSNRELLASNEEMQSTNEELQSVNEELYTVNNELQLKNEELRNSKNDISNLLKSTDIGTVFLDEQLLIRRFTPAIRKQFDLHSSDIGRPITSFSSTFFGLDIEPICREVLEHLDSYEKEVRDQDNNFYLFRVLPYRNDQDEIDGLVITFVAINDLVIARKRLVAMAKMYEAITNNAQDTIAIVTENSRIEEVNHPLAGQPAESLVGTYFTDLLIDDVQRAKFTRAIRQVFDSEESVRKLLQIVPTEKSEPDSSKQHFVTIEFIPTVTFVDHTEERLATRATLFVRDVTEEELEKREIRKLLESYKEAFEKSERQGGLIDTEGNIVHLNRSRQADMSVEDYLQQSIYDFLTDSGRQAYDTAIEKIYQGSFQETVQYQSEDLRYGAQAVTVAYRPVISNGEIVFINVHEVSEEE